MKITDDMVEKAAEAYWFEVYGRHRKKPGKWPECVYGGSDELFRAGCRSALTAALAVQTQPNLPVDAPTAFGLEAQGHIPAVEAALAEGADWQEIGRRIGWHGETAKQYYERHLARSALVDVPALESEPVAKPDWWQDEEAAEREFTEYFVRNYPGPDTIIHDPKWHAPKLFRAAKRALLATRVPTPPSPNGGDTGEGSATGTKDADHG